jgi:hypothetical protein
MADTLNKLRSDLENRIREIEPLIEEHARIRQALEALKSLGGSRPGEGSSPTARPAGSRPRAAANEITDRTSHQLPVSAATTHALKRPSDRSPEAMPSASQSNQSAAIASLGRF